MRPEPKGERTSLRARSVTTPWARPLPPPLKVQVMLPPRRAEVGEGRRVEGRAGRRPGSALLAPRPPRVSGELGRVRVPRPCRVYWRARIRIPCCVAERAGRVCRT